MTVTTTPADTTEKEPTAEQIARIQDARNALEQGRADAERTRLTASRDYQLALRALSDEGLTAAAISEHAGISATAVKNWLNKADIIVPA